MTLIDNIRKNPLRTLGVFVDDSKALESTNYNRFVAYAKVGKPIDLSMPYDVGLGLVNRDPACLDQALQLISLPADRVHYALFWFACDDTRPWSSILNSAIKSIIEGKYIDAIRCYEALIYDPQNFEPFIKAATKGLTPCSPDEAADFVVDAFSGISQSLFDLLLSAQVPAGSKLLARLFGDGSDMMKVYIDGLSGFNNTFYSYPEFNVKVEEAITVNKLYGLIMGRDNNLYQVFSEFLANEILKKGGEVIGVLAGWANTKRSKEALVSLVDEMKTQYDYYRNSAECVADGAGVRSYVNDAKAKFDHIYVSRNDYVEDMIDIVRGKCRKLYLWSIAAIAAIYIYLFAFTI